MRRRARALLARARPLSTNCATTDFRGATAGCLLVPLPPPLSTNSPVPVPDSSTRIEPLEDLDIVLAEDSLELIEDWEFYRWLEDVQDVG